MDTSQHFRSNLKARKMAGTVPWSAMWALMFIHRRFATKTARTKCNGFGKSKEFVVLQTCVPCVGLIWSSVWGYLGPVWGYVGPIWGYVGPMWAYLRLMLGLCWAYLDPFLAYIGPDQEFWPLLKNMQKQSKPPKLKLISYNAIANGSRRHTKNASAPSVRADFNLRNFFLDVSWWFRIPHNFWAPKGVVHISNSWLGSCFWTCSRLVEPVMSTCHFAMTWWFKSSAWNLLGERFTAYQESNPLIYQCTAWLRLGIVAFGWLKIGHPKATTKLKWIVCLGTPKPIFLSYPWKATFQWFLRLDGGEWTGLHIRMI